MNLLFAIKSLDVKGGGAERVLAFVVSGLAERGHRVTVVTFDAPGGESFYPLHAGVRRVALDAGPVDRATSPAVLLERIDLLRGALRRARPDAAVAFMHSMFVPMALAGVGLGIPLVASEHIVPAYYRRRRVQYALLVAACLMSRRVTVVSESVRDLYPAFLRARMVPVPNPIVVSGATAAERDPRRAPPRIVLAVGRLDDQKDHASLIRGFARVAGHFPDWKVRIVGEGALRGDLERLVAELGLSGRVELPGTTDRIDEEYARADIMAVPSRFESFGMATVEALASGLPVLGFADCPGTNELVRHDHNGWLVAPGSDRAAAFAEGLAALMADDALRRRLGREGPPGVTRLAARDVTADWEALLRGVARAAVAPRGGAPS